MAILVAPPDIEAVFDKPGRDWTFDERRRLMVWLVTPPQLDQLLRYAAKHLGTGTTDADAIDTLKDFFVVELGRTIDLYDPSRGLRFQSYLLMRLRQACWRAGERIRARKEESLAGNDADGEPFELELADPNAATEQTIVDHVALQQCLESMPLAYRVVIESYYFDGRSVRECAALLGIGEPNVKVRLFRARAWLRRCLAPA